MIVLHVLDFVVESHQNLLSVHQPQGSSFIGEDHSSRDLACGSVIVNGTPMQV